MSEWSEISAAVAAVAAGLGGERDEGERRLVACWAATSEFDHAQRCVLADYLADLQTDLDEARWDGRALSSYRHVLDDDLSAVGIPTAARSRAEPAPLTR